MGDFLLSVTLENIVNTSQSLSLILLLLTLLLSLLLLYLLLSLLLLLLLLLVPLILVSYLLRTWEILPRRCCWDTISCSYFFPSLFKRLLQMYLLSSVNARCFLRQSTRITLSYVNRHTWRCYLWTFNALFEVFVNTVVGFHVNTH